MHLNDSEERSLPDSKSGPGAWALFATSEGTRGLAQQGSSAALLAMAARWCPCSQPACRADHDQQVHYQKTLQVYVEPESLT